MKTTNEKNEKIQEYKNDLLWGFGNHYKRGTQYQQAQCIIDTLLMEGEGFAVNVAKTVDKYKRCSEKQAYIIARSFVEQNLNQRFEN